MKRNVFDIPRSQLLTIVMKLRQTLINNNLNYEIQDDDALHSIPIKEMSNYDEYPNRNSQPAPLREIDAAPVRQHVFGNPFKVNKVCRKIPNLNYCILFVHLSQSMKSMIWLHHLRLLHNSQQENVHNQNQLYHPVVIPGKKDEHVRLFIHSLLFNFVLFSFSNSS